MSAFSSLRKIANTISHRSVGTEMPSILRENGGLMAVNRLDVDAADEIAEKIIIADEFQSLFFLAPLNVSNLIKNGDMDGNEYWKQKKPLYINILSKVFNWRYGIDFVILRRGLFSMIAVLTKSNEGEWTTPNRFIDYIIPDSPDIFRNVTEFYFKHSDTNQFPIDVVACRDSVTAINGDKNIKKESCTIHVNISFLRTETFINRNYADGRNHATYNMYMEGLLHSLALEYRILSFDDIDIEKETRNDTNDKIPY